MLIKAESIREAYYPEWISNMVLVKKANIKWRVYTDVTHLNRVCPKDSFPLHRIYQLVDVTVGHELLSFMDAYSGHNQIIMAPKDEENASFITNQGLYCYKIIPFELKNARTTYQRLVNKMFAELLGKSMKVYVDAMLVKNLQVEQHIQHLEQTFLVLSKYKMRLNLAKYAFRVASGKFLEFMVHNRGIEANLEKIQSLLKMKSPVKVRDVQC